VEAPTRSRAISVEVNGEQIEMEVPARRLLVHFIRDDLGLTGTHVGCDTGNCGACSSTSSATTSGSRGRTSAATPGTAARARSTSTASL